MKPNNLVTPEPGNQLAVKSGAYSPIIVGAKADELRSHVIEAAAMDCRSFVQWHVAAVLHGAGNRAARPITHRQGRRGTRLWRGAVTTGRNGQRFNEHSGTTRNVARFRSTRQGHDPISYCEH